MAASEEVRYGVRDQIDARLQGACIPSSLKPILTASSKQQEAYIAPPRQIAATKQAGAVLSIMKCSGEKRSFSIVVNSAMPGTEYSRPRIRLPQADT